MKTFPLSEEERKQLFHFKDTLKRLLLETQRQTKAKLTSIYKAVVEGTYRVEGKRLYAPDGAWIYVNERTAPYIPIHDLSAETYFPDVLKLLREKIELLQIGWRASDESHERNRPFMATAQPWQVFSWTAVRYGELRIRVDSANLTREGVSVLIRTIARSWRQKWSKNEAISLVADFLRRGEWVPLLTAWLGDGESKRKNVLRAEYQIVIVAKEPWRLGHSVGTRKALVATGKEAFVKLKEAAGIYGELLDLLRAHKWVVVKLATDDGFRAAYKLKARKRSIDRLREAYRQNNGEISIEQFSQVGRQGRSAVVVAGVVMRLRLIKGGSLLAERYVRDVVKALAIAGRLELAGLRPNVVRIGSYYMVYIATADLLRLAERDKTIRKAIALYLAEKAKNGTPRQREIAEKILKRHPLFLSSQSPRRFLEADIAMR
jgi:hypothetical protein